MNNCLTKHNNTHNHQWFVVDAQGETLGRLATQIAHVLRGKHKPSFSPHLDCGDNVVVINANQISLTGNKWQQKFYHHHTGYIGGIKSISAASMLLKAPENIVKLAVRGMIPKTKLGRKQLLNLKVYAQDTHPHQAQMPKKMPERTAKKVMS